MLSQLLKFASFIVFVSLLNVGALPTSQFSSPNGVQQNEGMSSPTFPSASNTQLSQYQQPSVGIADGSQDNNAADGVSAGESEVGDSAGESGATTFIHPAPIATAASNFPQAIHYQKYPRQILPVQFAQPTYSTLPSRFVPAQIPHIKPTTHTKQAPPIQQPAQFARNKPIQAPPLYGKAQ